MKLIRSSHLRAWLLGVAWLALAVSPAALAAGLRDLSGGQPRSIDDYTGHGKWLVVMIWASDCSVCNTDAHEYVDFYNAHRGKDIAMLGVSMDGWSGRAAAEAFVRRHHVSFPNLIGEPESVARLYQNLTGQSWVGTPTFLIYDPSGTLRVQQAGNVPAKLIEDYIRSHAARPDQARGSAHAAGAALALRR